MQLVVQLVVQLNMLNAATEVSIKDYLKRIDNKLDLLLRKKQVVVSPAKFMKKVNVFDTGKETDVSDNFGKMLPISVSKVTVPQIRKSIENEQSPNEAQSQWSFGQALSPDPLLVKAKCTDVPPAPSASDVKHHGFTFMENAPTSISDVYKTRDTYVAPPPNYR